MAKKKTAKTAKMVKGTWTKKDLALLKKMFSGNSTAKVAKALGRPLDAVKKKASRMKLKKTKSYMKSIGRS